MNTAILGLLIFGFRFSLTLLCLAVAGILLPVAYMARRGVHHREGQARMGDME